MSAPNVSTHSDSRPVEGALPPSAGQAADLVDAEAPPTRWWTVFALWSIPMLVELSQRLTTPASAGENVSWGSLIMMAAFWYSWALLTPAIFWLTRRAPIRRPHRARGLWIHAVAGSCIAAASIAALAAFPESMEDPASATRATYGERVTRGLATGYPSLMMVYSVLVAIGMGLDLRHRYRQGELRRTRLERRLTEARLAMLRMQLQPHFLFNTLHAISALMDDDVPAARRMIARLSELLRLTLASDGEGEVPLEREIEVLEAYLDIERVRLGDRLRVEYAVDGAARRALVPALLLQPLVENAVRHAVAPSLAPCRVRVGGRVDGDVVRLSVADDGLGMSAEAAGGSNGIGLANTRARLEQRFGPAARMNLENGDGRGFEVRIVLPLSRAPAEVAAGDEADGDG